MRGFFAELKRRNVIRAGVTYVVVAWLILQVADVILPNLGAPEWAFRGLLLLLAIGFPVVLVVAWVFELTPSGFKRDSSEAPVHAPTGDRGRQFDYVVISMLAVLVGYFAYDKFVLSVADDDKSIAVLPFANMSRDPEQEYFADGLSEELLNLLAKVPALRVIARTSSFAYKDQQEATIAQIASDLKVAHVLEGSVRKDAGNQVRITAQLIRADDESHLWSETYDRDLSDIFSIQDEIAAAVVSELKVRILGEAPTATQVDAAAYEFYLQARELSPDTDPERAIELYRKALDRQPDYAAAWAGIAENYVYLSGKVLLEATQRALKHSRCRSDDSGGFDPEKADWVDEAYEEARCAANTALKLDSEQAFAFASLGRIAMVRDGNFSLAAKHFERALALDPGNAQIIRQVAILSANLNRLQEAVALLEYALARDPISPAVHNNLALNYYYAREWAKSAATYRAAIKLSANPSGLQSFLGVALVFDGDPEAGLVAINKERHADTAVDNAERRPWRLIGQAIAYHALGRASESDRSLQALIDDYGDEWGFSVAYVLAFRGDIDRSFDWLEQARANNDSGLSEIASEPAFDNLKSDPRWLPFLQSVGKAPSQLASVKFDVTLPPAVAL